MSTANPQIFASVSANLRRTRQQRGWSQEKLATEAGISRRMLVNIESGDSNVSLGMLDRLAGVLGLSFAELVRPPAEPGAPAPAGPVRVWQGATPDSHGTLLENLIRHGLVVELWEWRLAPGEEYEAVVDPPGSCEMIFMIDGELCLELAGQTRRLTAGQSLTFPSDQPYRYRNDGERPAYFSKNVIVEASGRLAARAPSAAATAATTPSQSSGRD